MMSQSHGIKAQTTNEAFQEQWERGVSVDTDLDLFNFQDPLHAEEGIERRKGKKKKKKDKS